MKHNIYQTIRDRILYLEYQPNTILNEKKLGEEFGISRSPVRDILNRLEWEHLVRIIPRTGSMVTEIEFTKIMNVFQIRFECEAFESQLAGERLTQSHINILEDLKNQCLKLIDSKNRKALAAIDFAIREVIHDAAGNPVLKDVSERLYTQTFRLWYDIMNRGELNEEIKCLHEELEELINAISYGNAKQLGEIRRNRIGSHFERLRLKFFNP